MKTWTGGREWLFLGCMAIAALASGAAPPADVVLDEIDVSGAKLRERARDPARAVNPTYDISIRRDGVTGFEVKLKGPRQQEIRFRRSSSARQLAAEGAKAKGPGAPLLSGDRVIATDDKLLGSIQLTLQPNVDEADGLPASIPFGPHASLVNVDYVRLRDTRGDTGIDLLHAIHPQTRRCEKLLLVDEGSDFSNRFVMLADSSADCRRIERSRQDDLIFADAVPAALRQAVLEVYDPVATRMVNRLGSEPGLVFVAWWPDSPHNGYRFEQGWNRNSLLLFHGTAWQQGLDAQQREALRDVFAAEQVGRRFRQTDSAGAFNESTIRYLLELFTAEQAGDTQGWLTEALPGWIAGCTEDLGDFARIAAIRGGEIGRDCGLVVQFVYDAVVRAQSSGSDNLYDTWRRLLGESYRRGESGAKPAAFLASSDEARRIARGLLDGTVNWRRLTTDLDGIGVKLRVELDGPRSAVAVLSLAHFRD